MKLFAIFFISMICDGFPNADLHWDFMYSSNNKGVDVWKGVKILDDETACAVLLPTGGSALSGWEFLTNNCDELSTHWGPI